MADQSPQQMRQMVVKGHAMPAPGDSPGRFPIANRDDLQNAIRAVGRVRPNTDAARAQVRRFIIKRAGELKLQSMIPPNWNTDGSLKP